MSAIDHLFAHAILTARQGYRRHEIDRHHVALKIHGIILRAKRDLLRPAQLILIYHLLHPDRQEVDLDVGVAEGILTSVGEEVRTFVAGEETPTFVGEGIPIFVVGEEILTFAVGEEILTSVAGEEILTSAEEEVQTFVAAEEEVAVEDVTLLRIGSVSRFGETSRHQCHDGDAIFLAKDEISLVKGASLNAGMEGTSSDVKMIGVRIGTTRDQLPPPRLESRRSDESIISARPPPPVAQTLQIDPGRLALLEQAGVDLSLRRPSVPQNVPPPREQPGRREQPETPSYLNGRAETTANRYAQRGSSPPTQAPPVPAFTLSFAPSAPTPTVANTAPLPSITRPVEKKEDPITTVDHRVLPGNVPVIETPVVSYSAPSEPARQQPTPATVPQTQARDTLQEAPKAPRLTEDAINAGTAGRLHGVRSMDNVQGNGMPPAAQRPEQADTFAKPLPAGPRAASPAMSAPSYPTIIQPPVQAAQPPRFGELAAPTGPRATLRSPALASVSPRPPFASPRSDVGGFHGMVGPPRGQTPPPMAPSGPRNRSFSVSPKVTSSTVPTAPRGIRAPPLAPRAADRAPGGLGRGIDRFGAQLGAQPSWAPPTAPKSLQWNQWRRPGPAGPAPFGDKIVPAKRDFLGEEKGRPLPGVAVDQTQVETVRRDDAISQRAMPAERPRPEDKMDIDHEPISRNQQPSATDHSARQSFFGKPEEPAEDIVMSEAADDVMSSSDDDDLDPQQDLALFKAKFERQKRVLEGQMIEISAREYRATTPRESIARLSRLSERDLKRALQHREMDAEGSPTGTENICMPPATNSSGTEEGPEVSTPKGEAEVMVDVHSGGEDSGRVSRHTRRPSPEVISLPYLIKHSREFEDAQIHHETVYRQDASKADVIIALNEQDEEDYDEKEGAQADFDDIYHEWRQQCADLDRQREDQERLERQMSLEPGPDMHVSVPLQANPTIESRRLHKFSSEYDVQMLLKQTEDIARQEQEQHERQTRKLQADMEKEAKIADQESEHYFKRGIFIDANRLRDPHTLTIVFSFEPQPDTFTQEEQDLFVAAFKETPKKWGEIATLLHPKSYKDCIHHYYANKWDGRFRDHRTKKLKAGGRRGRGGKMRGRGGGAMADMARVEEILPPQSMSESGRPRRAAAPTTFGEKEVESKVALMNPSPAKKLGPLGKQDGNGEAVTDKPIKRRRAAGDKPGRKAKASLAPYAALAAAPIASPNKPYMQGYMATEDQTRAQDLEGAAVLAGLNAHHMAMMPMEPQAVYQQDDYAASMASPEEAARMKAAGQVPGSRSGASSYWSVPEQQDFVKYIAHFGTDFAAIANHMGTKTQTMIKNHYQRQVGNGNQPELENAAKEADRRRELGDEVGPPPTPTPIVKRKYDAPQPNAPRTLAPNTDAMELDEPNAPARQAQVKHMSPPQYQAQPRFIPSAQSTPIPAQRVVPSPIPSTASPAAPKMQAAPPRPTPHPLGAGLAFTSESRPESRPGLPTSNVFRHSQGSMPRSQPPPQQQPPQHQDIVERLREEQDRAFRVQEGQQQEPFAQLHRQPSFHRGSAQGSPADQPLRDPGVERKPLFEQRANTPPRAVFSQNPFARSVLGSSSLGPFRSTPSSLMGRAPLQPSPPKREEPRPALVSAPIVQPHRASMPAPPPDPPRRSNLMSILNDEPDEPKPSKRDSLPSFVQRAASPAPSNTSNAPTTAPGSNMHPLRRETFGQPSMPQSQLHRPSFSQAGSASSATPASVKQEQGGMSGPKVDWAARLQGQPERPTPPPVFERDVRGYFSHRTAAFGGLNQPDRANPSPPPHSVLGHSRTSSLTMQANPPLRDPRPGLPNQSPHPNHGPALHTNPYAQQQHGHPFPQPPPPDARDHSHPSHSRTVSGAHPFPHQRAPSRDDIMRQDQQQQVFAMSRERDDMERQRREQQDFEFRHREALIAQHRQQQLQEEERDRERQQRHQQMFSRGPPMPQHPQQAPGFNGPPFPHDRPPPGIRDQVNRELEAEMRREEMRVSELRGREESMQREQRDHERRHFEEMSRRRQHEEAVRRQTPLGGKFGHPPPPRR
ncbi:hypothetical protein LTR27_006385 [Elasticomyces elasticus]|nr:hypothetical protein LTR27_006385 [Elasticomyces elasticus]